MKRFIYFLAIILFLMAAAALSVRPAVLWIARRQIAAVFIDGKVSIKDARILPLRRASLSGIAIKRDGAYDLEIGEVSVDYSVDSLLRKEILKISLDKADVEVSLPRQNISDLTRHVRPGHQGALTIKELAVSDLSLKVLTKDLRLEARVSAELALADLSIHSLELTVASLQNRGFLLKDGVLRVNRKSGPDEFRVGDIQYNKVKVTGMNGIVRLENGIFFLDAFSAQTFNGLVTGNATLQTGAYPEYLVNLECADLSLERFVDDFDLGEKIQMSGLLSGRLILRGQGTDVEVLDGDFSMAKTGGTLVIKDASMLENVAQGTGQSVDLIVESFKNYHYNNGALTVSLEEGDLRVDMALDGEAGKRDLNIVVHDFRLTKPIKDGS